MSTGVVLPWTGPRARDGVAITRGGRRRVRHRQRCAGGKPSRPLPHKHGAHIPTLDWYGAPPPSSPHNRCVKLQVHCACVCAGAEQFLAVLCLAHGHQLTPGTLCRRCASAMHVALLTRTSKHQKQRPGPQLAQAAQSPSCRRLLHQEQVNPAEQPQHTCLQQLWLLLHWLWYTAASDQQLQHPGTRTDAATLPHSINQRACMRCRSA